ncbi:7-cyano-7-deazaguanine synthase QueC [bacterium]|nr:7-cyano-7-deazaguanine synthase QueC [bacterium]
MSKALVIFSGGQDSTTCLGYAKKKYDEVVAISFKYGQKHSVELEQARKIAKKLNIELHEIDISFFGQLVDSALTHNGNVNQNHNTNKNLPASWVPNRNALFITISHAFAQKIGADVLVTGVCDSDYSGYPDCRREFIESIQKTLSLASETNIKIDTPLMKLSKAETFKLAEDCDILDIVVNDSHTCYNGDREHKHEWGYGCGDCPSCRLREKGYNEFKEKKGK